jgi:hypothetical protein
MSDHSNDGIAAGIDSNGMRALHRRIPPVGRSFRGCIALFYNNETEPLLHFIDRIDLHSGVDRQLEMIIWPSDFLVFTPGRLGGNSFSSPCFST